MWQELIDAIEAITGTPADTVALPGTARCAVIHAYAGQSIYGEDANIFDVPRAQIDIYTPTLSDDLIEQICALLQSWHLPYEIMDQGYDDDTNRMRTILQLDVL